jgi:hypothetical protein
LSVEIKKEEKIGEQSAFRTILAKVGLRHTALGYRGCSGAMRIDGC